MSRKTAIDLRAKILRALADPVRLELLEYLSDGEKCTCQILPAFSRSQSTVSKHMNILYDAGILERRTDGRRTLYRIRDERVLDILQEVDFLAQSQIEDLAKIGQFLEAKRAPSSSMEKVA
ncbi:MAG: winged helix-turn-helix transcriptional regulator [Methanotrichaceae archaeon]|nr:winged helix-turn-helix transcriptional regulator [Methanotrichaceae archaeon]